MGLSVSVYRWGLGDCTNGGVSAVAGSLCVVNVRGLLTLPQPCQPLSWSRGPGAEAMQSFARSRRKSRAWWGRCSGAISAIRPIPDFPRRSEVNGFQALRGRGDT
jgi:hypothetical protein